MVWKKATNTNKNKIPLPISFEKIHSMFSLEVFVLNKSLRPSEFNSSLENMTKRLKSMTINLMSSSCHLDRSLNVEICDKCQIFVIVIFFNCRRVLQFGAHSRHYKGALTQKGSFLVICTTFREDFMVAAKQNKHSTLNSSFDVLFRTLLKLNYCKKVFFPDPLIYQRRLSDEKVGNQKN